jgi:hypothetical protein
MFVRIALVAVTVAVCVAGASMPMADAATATMKLAPGSQNVANNATSVSVDLTISDAAGVGGWEAGIRYNTEVLELMSVSEGPWLKDSGKSTNCIKSEQKDLGDDVVLYGCGITGGRFEGHGGSGVLATFTFKPKTQGVSQLLFVKRELADPLGDGLAVDSEDGVIKVVAPGEDLEENLEPTPRPNDVRLTPTALPEQERDPFVRTGGSTGGSTSGSGSDGSSGSGAIARGSQGPTSERAGASRSGQAGAAGSNENRNVGPDGAPIAGTGPGERDSGNGWLLGGALVLLVGGVAVGTGLVRAHRTSGTR